MKYNYLYEKYTYNFNLDFFIPVLVNSTADYFGSI